METQNNYNPDVLSCLANLSSDEVFTPPKLANEILDLLPKDIWKDKNATFLDPVCKSGVFLREIAKRLIEGLKNEIPDIQKRIDHIYNKQLFGIGITKLTALLARRSLYCSKKANGKYAVSSVFKDEQGNIFLEKTNHDWKNGRCSFCGASQSEYEREEGLETHAYQFIHNKLPDKIKNMKFDVIIGNPPYQLSDAGFGRSSSPLYHKFIEQAKKLNPRYLTMIIPSRWFAGGKGLDEFREQMLNDSRIRNIIDYENASEVFPGVDIAGGICIFKWDRDNSGLCKVINRRAGEEYVSVRKLNEYKTFIRNSQAISTIRKVSSGVKQKMNEQVTSRKPFGLPTSARPEKRGDIKLHWQKGEGQYFRNMITVGVDMIDKWKVITSYVGYDHAGNPGKDGKRRVFSKIEILPPGTICTETYLVVGAYDTQKQANNLVAYMKTKFFRFLVSQFMFSHHITKEAYSFVPILDMNQSWTDAKLYEKFDITKKEQTFIESMIRPMN